MTGQRIVAALLVFLGYIFFYLAYSRQARSADEAAYLDEAIGELLAGGELHRWDVVNGTRWAKVQVVRMDSAPDAMLVCARWSMDRTIVNETSVVYAYVAGEQVFGAVHVWWLDDRPCVLRSVVLGEPEDTLSVLFVLAYDAGQQSLENGTADMTISPMQDITHAREKAVYDVVRARGGGRNNATSKNAAHFPWGAWRPMEPRPPPSAANAQCVTGLVQKDATCDGERIAPFTSGTLANLPLPAFDWVWYPSNASAAHEPSETCLRQHWLHFMGDSIYQQIVSLLTLYHEHQEFSRPVEGRCSARVFPPSSAQPPVSFERVYMLQNSTHVANFTHISKTLFNASLSAPPQTKKVLIFNTGLHNLISDYSVEKLEESLHALFAYFQSQAAYDRVIITTATHVHVLLKLNGVPGKIRLTATRTKALNQLYWRVLSSGRYPRLELLDVSQPTISAPWGVRPDDSIHYCRPVIQEMMMLVWRHLCPA